MTNTTLRTGLLHEVVHAIGEILTTHNPSDPTSPASVVFIHMEEQPNGPEGTALGCFSDFSVVATVMHDVLNHKDANDRWTSMEDMAAFQTILRRKDPDTAKMVLGAHFASRWLHRHRVAESIVGTATPDRGIYALLGGAVYGHVARPLQNLFALIDKRAPEAVIEAAVDCLTPVGAAPVLSRVTDTPEATARFLKKYDEQRARAQEATA